MTFQPLPHLAQCPIAELSRDYHCLLTVLPNYYYYYYLYYYYLYYFDMPFFVNFAAYTSTGIFF